MNYSCVFVFQLGRGHHKARSHRIVCEGHDAFLRYLHARVDTYYTFFFFLSNSLSTRRRFLGSKKTKINKQTSPGQRFDRGVLSRIIFSKHNIYYYFRYYTRPERLCFEHADRRGFCRERVSLLYFIVFPRTPERSVRAGLIGNSTTILSANAILCTRGFFGNPLGNTLYFCVRIPSVFSEVREPVPARSSFILYIMAVLK